MRWCISSAVEGALERMDTLEEMSSDREL
jgi:hypothetical protein